MADGVANRAALAVMGKPAVRGFGKDRPSSTSTTLMFGSACS